MTFPRMFGMTFLRNVIQIDVGRMQAFGMTFLRNVIPTLSDVFDKPRRYDII